MISTLCLLALAPPLMSSLEPLPRNQAEHAGEPFSYLLYPSDVVGFRDCPQAFQLTYDGALNNGFGELQLLAGKEPTLIDVRLKTLVEGSLPFPQYRFERDGIAFHVEFFGAPKGLDPREDLVAYVRVTASNPTRDPKSTNLVAQFGERGARNRSDLACREWYRDRFMDFAKWSGSGPLTRTGGMVSKAGHLVFAYSGDPEPSAGGVRYDVRLEPSQTATMMLKVPFVPVDLKRAAQVAAVTGTDSEDAIKTVSAFWKDLYGKATQIELPERKVSDTVRASLAYDLIATDVLEDGKSFMPTVNKFQYHTFYFRDGAFTTHMFDLMNMPEAARRGVQYYFVTNPDGSAKDIKRGGEDDWGQSLWAIGAHFRARGDTEFARYVFPALAPHMANFQQNIASDPLGLWPKLGPYDAELLTGHYTSHSFWVLLGLREAINLARATGHEREATLWQSWHDGYRRRFMAQLAKVTALSDGYIPPGIDRPQDGRDWENATAGVYPFGVIDKSDPRVPATLRLIREYKWREGISTWGTNAWVIKTRMREGVEEDPGTLHHYQMYNLTQTALALGMQRDVLEDLYSALAHTTATHAGFEMGTRPWGERDVAGNYTPHGWFAARTVELVRNMLVREEGETLHLASCLSPEWVRAGQVIRLTNAATNFGMVSYVVRSRKDGADIEVSNKWRNAPKAVVLHVPFFVRLESATVDGKKVVPSPLARNVKDLKILLTPLELLQPAGDRLTLSPGASRIRLNWKWIGDPELSYARAVEIWKAKDKDRRPEVDRNFLFPHPTMPKLDVDARAFTSAAPVRLLNTSGKGEIRFTLDGSEPTASSPKYTVPFEVSKTTWLKAATFWSDGRLSDPLVARLEVGFAAIPTKSEAVAAGIVGEFFAGKFDTVPDFGSLKPARTFTLAQFGLGEPNPPEETYAMRLSGVIEIPTDGVYRFWTGSDDGSTLRIGDRLVVNNDGLHAYTEVPGDIALRKGRYPITVGFFEAGGGHILRAFWAGPGFAKQEIPGSSLGH
ncbi:MAG: chitobiase/beta-hexosaminidase C-terminal domain-containing protein [Fimbriimonas sp.]